MLDKVGYWLIRTGFSVPKFNKLQKYTNLLAIRDLLRSLEIDIVLDVGANKGQYAEQLRSLGYEGTIISFEPIPMDFEILKTKSAADDKWFVINKAVGDTNEIKKFHLNEIGNSTVMSSFLDAQRFASKKQIDVEVVRLDQMDLSSYSDLASPRYFLKTDTQGYDLHVWRGTSNMREQVVGLQAEVSVLPIYEGSPHFTDVIAIFENDGFNLVSMNVVSRNKHGLVVEYDCVMSRSTNTS